MFEVEVSRSFSSNNSFLFLSRCFLVLPIGDFFEAHKINLARMQSSCLPWRLLCPGFLREPLVFRNPPRAIGGHISVPKEVRVWKDVNDERLGGLSAT